jgi:branched-chain amino acid transport system substrate-binding protein
MDGQLSPPRQIYSRRRILALGGSAAALLAACGNNDVVSDASVVPGGPASAAPVGSDVTLPLAPTAVPLPSETVVINTTVPSDTPANAAAFGGGGTDGTLKIGFTAPLTGALAGFAEANQFVVDSITTLCADGLMIGAQSYTVQVIQKDVASDPGMAATAAGELIVDDEVDVIVAIATPEMINPVADQCEANGVPCLSTLALWQPYFSGRGGDPAKGFDWTFHFYSGVEQLTAVFVDLWNGVETNKTIGLLCPNDADGIALADPAGGLPAGANGAGYQVVDPGRFESSTTDFSTIIGQMRDGGVEIVCGTATSAEFTSFWTQAKQQGFNPKLVTVAKAVSISSAVEALAGIGDGLATDVSWSPDHPFTSSLTGQPSKQLSNEYESTGKQWTQYLGFVHALFEVCFDVVARAGSTDKQAIAAAAASTSLVTVVGPVAYGSNGAPKNVSSTSLVGGQWQRQTGATFPFELLVVDNHQTPVVPTNGQLTPLM